jgi:hypothetical protein
LIELLVAMIIIAILLAVAIPTFTAHKRRAAAVDAKEQVLLAYKTLQTCQVDTLGDPLQCDRDDIVALERPLEKRMKIGKAPGGLRFDTDPDMDEPLYAVAIVAWTNTGETDELQEVRFRLDVEDDGSVTKYCNSANQDLRRQICPTGKW